MVQYVRFDVGHSLHVCRKETILKYPDSMLAKLILNSEFVGNSESYICIDRDGRHFMKILDFMRDEESLKLQDMNPHSIRLLLEEAKFYCLDRLIQLCEDEILNYNSSMIGDFMIMYSQEELSKLISCANKPIIMVSFEKLLSSQTNDKNLRHLLKSLPFLDRDKVDIVGFFGEPKQPAGLDGMLHIYSPISGRVLNSYPDCPNHRLMNLVLILNSGYGLDVNDNDEEGEVVFEDDDDDAAGEFQE